MEKNVETLEYLINVWKQFSHFVEQERKLVSVVVDVGL